MANRRVQLTSPYSGSYDANMQEFYIKSMRSLIPNLCPLLDWFTKAGSVQRVRPQGKKIVFGVEYLGSSGYGYRGEGDFLPDAASVSSVQGSVEYQKAIKGRTGLTWEALKFGKGGSTFNSMQKQEFKNAMVMMRYFAQVALWGVGDAMLARVSAGGGGAATTLTCYSNEVYNACQPGTRWLKEGIKIISCLSTVAYAKDAGMTAADTIASITADTTANTSSNNNVTADYYLVQHHCTDTATAAELAKGSVTLDTASSSRQPQGMLALCDDGTRVSSYCGISEATYPQWKAIKQHNSGTKRSLTLDLFYNTWYKLSRKAGTFDMDLTSWTNTDLYTTLTKLVEHFTSYKPRQYQPGFNHYDIMIDGHKIPIRLDHECPSYFFFLDPKEIIFAEGQPPQIGRETGSMWRDVANKDDYEAVWRWVFQTFTTKRNSHAILEDLNVTINSV